MRVSKYLWKWMMYSPLINSAVTIKRGNLRVWSFFISPIKVRSGHPPMVEKSHHWQTRVNHYDGACPKAPNWVRRQIHVQMLLLERRV
jgi:hypothetical protein